MTSSHFSYLLTYHETFDRTYCQECQWPHSKILGKNSSTHELRFRPLSALMGSTNRQQNNCTKRRINALPIVPSSDPRTEVKLNLLRTLVWCQHQKI